MKDKMQITMNPDQISIKSSAVVRLTNVLTVITPDGPKDLIVDISADLGDVSEEYHEVFLNVITAKYLGKVSFGDNPFSKCEPSQKGKWWKFWGK